jgi:hypothetical protein
MAMNLLSKSLGTSLRTEYWIALKHRQCALISGAHYFELCEQAGAMRAVNGSD